MRSSSELRFLIVEDDPRKLSAIREDVLTMKVLDADVCITVDTAECYTDATRRLESKYYDVIILDLRIPILVQGDAEVNNSKLLYEYIHRSAPSKPFYILGLTSAGEDEIRQVFPEDANFSIERYSPNGQWLEKLRHHIGFVVSAKAGLANYLNHNNGIDVLIVTARKVNEFDPILESIAWEGNFSKARRDLNGMRNQFGQVDVGDGRLVSLGVICLDEMGLSHSAAITTNLVHMFRPRLMAMLGMCCGLKKLAEPDQEKNRGKTKLGDVIVASETSCWDEGKYEDNDPKLVDSPFFNNRAVNKYPDRDFWRVVERFLDQEHGTIENQIATYYDGMDKDKIRANLKGGVKFLSNAVLHRQPIVSGTCVIDSGSMISEIEARFPRAFGLEMEAHAFYSAVDCCMGLKPKALVIKGVADFGDGTKAKTVQKLASVAAYLTYKAIIGLEFQES